MFTFLIYSFKSFSDDGFLISVLNLYYLLSKTKGVIVLSAILILFIALLILILGLTRYYILSSLLYLLITWTYLSSLFYNITVLIPLYFLILFLFVNGLTIISFPFLFLFFNLGIYITKSPVFIISSKFIYVLLRGGIILFTKKNNKIFYLFHPLIYIYY